MKDLNELKKAFDGGWKVSPYRPDVLIASQDVSEEFQVDCICAACGRKLQEEKDFGFCDLPDTYYCVECEKEATVYRRRLGSLELPTWEYSSPLSILFFLVTGISVEEIAEELGQDQFDMTPSLNQLIDIAISRGFSVVSYLSENDEDLNEYVTGKGLILVQPDREPPKFYMFGDNVLFDVDSSVGKRTLGGATNKERIQSLNKLAVWQFHENG